MSKLRLPTPNLPLVFEISWNLVESGNTHFLEPAQVGSRVVLIVSMFGCTTPIL